MRRNIKQRESPTPVTKTRRIRRAHTMPANHPLSANERTQRGPEAPVTFTTPEGEIFEIADLPANLGRATAFAGEGTLRKIWDSSEEDKVWRDTLKGM